VTVINPPSTEPEGIVAFETTEGYPDAFAEYLTKVSEEVTRKITEVLENSGVESRAITPSGNPSSEILEIAESEKVNLIVIGLKGLRVLGRVRSLGSVARRVIEDSTRPVVVVP
jgi:nucleotide-binding universal stress UspA family protein